MVGFHGLRGLFQPKWFSVYLYRYKTAKREAAEAGLAVGCACLTRQKLTDCHELAVGWVGGLPGRGTWLEDPPLRERRADTCGSHTHLWLPAVLGLHSKLCICECVGFCVGWVKLFVELGAVDVLVCCSKSPTFSCLIFYVAGSLMRKACLSDAFVCTVCEIPVKKGVRSFLCLQTRKTLCFAVSECNWIHTCRTCTFALVPGTGLSLPCV